jgi:hypothetical protein
MVAGGDTRLATEDGSGGGEGRFFAVKGMGLFNCPPGVGGRGGTYATAPSRVVGGGWEGKPSVGVLRRPTGGGGGGILGGMEFFFAGSDPFAPVEPTAGAGERVPGRGGGTGERGLPSRFGRGGGVIGLGEGRSRFVLGGDGSLAVCMGRAGSCPVLRSWGLKSKT